MIKSLFLSFQANEKDLEVISSCKCCIGCKKLGGNNRFVLNQNNLATVCWASTWESELKLPTSIFLEHEERKVLMCWNSSNLKMGKTSSKTVLQKLAKKWTSLTSQVSTRKMRSESCVQRGIVKNHFEKDLGSFENTLTIRFTSAKWFPAFV